MIKQAVKELLGPRLARQVARSMRRGVSVLTFRPACSDTRRLAAFDAVETIRARSPQDPELSRLRDVLVALQGPDVEDQVIAGARRFLEYNRLDDALVLCSAALVQGGDARYHVAQSLVDYLNAKTFTPEDLHALVAYLSERDDINVVDLYKHVLNVALYVKGFDYTAIRPLLPRVPAEDLIAIANDCLGLGISNPASLLYQQALTSRPDDMLLRNQIANTEFLCGRYEEARRHWTLLAHHRNVVRAKYAGLDGRIRFLGDTWLMAIGHVATLGTFVNAMRLGLYGDIRPILVYQRRKPPMGMEILRLLSRVIEVHEIDGDHIEYKWRLISGGAPFDYDRAVEVVIGHTEDFWYAPDLDGSVSWYGPAGAAIDAAARARNLPPVLAYSEAERAERRILLERLYGLPRNAWFVGLHVREPGFHGAWHAAMPGTRNADIDTYEEVVDLIVQAGGYVVRLGDPTMKPFRPRPEVIDYATAPLRRSDLDIFLCAESRFFIGTNSGFSLVPSLFGVRSLLTNWSPIGTPNWITHDVLVPKLVWNRDEGRYLSIEEMYRSFTGWSQFMRDFDGTPYELHDNDPEALAEAVLEMMQAVMPEAANRARPGGRRPSAASQKAQSAAVARTFRAVVEDNGGYVGSMLSTSFAARHPHLLRRLNDAPRIESVDEVSERPREADTAVAHSQLRAASEKAESAADDASLMLEQTISRPRELGLEPVEGPPLARALDERGSGDHVASGSDTRVGG